MTGDIETLAVHGRLHETHPDGALNQPVYYSSSFKWNAADGVRYIRFGNTPNQLALASQLAALEGKADGVVTASGQAAIFSALLTNMPMPCKSPNSDPVANSEPDRPHSL